MKTKEVLYGLCTKSTPLMDVIEDAYNNRVSETGKSPTWTELTDEVAELLGICRWDADWDEHSRAIWHEVDIHMEDWFEDDEIEGEKGKKESSKKKALFGDVLKGFLVIFPQSFLLIVVIKLTSNMKNISLYINYIAQ